MVQKIPFFPGKFIYYVHFKMAALMALMETNLRNGLTRTATQSKSKLTNLTCIFQVVMPSL